ncbi:hypothetical protein ACEU2D_17180 [Brevibacillus laterosporus]|uniref:hypothetical protein n=1 Tax=Brevibacillus laterosporus TaxID=1465 RepID=UPI0035A5AFC4
MIRISVYQNEGAPIPEKDLDLIWNQFYRVGSSRDRKSGGEGFYISGDGQFSGFFYNPKMKGEKGEVTFYFKNEKGNQLEWKKELTLQ